MIWLKVIIILIIIVGISWVNLNYVQPYGMMFGDGYCYNLTNEGYFIGGHDAANHRNCTIGYEEGRNKSKDWACPYRENCFSYDSYNDTCEENLDMKDFGMRCTWMSLGYMASMLTIILWGFVVVGIFAILLKMYELSVGVGE